MSNMLLSDPVNYCSYVISKMDTLKARTGSGCCDSAKNINSLNIYAPARTALFQMTHRSSQRGARFPFYFGSVENSNRKNAITRSATL